MGHKNALPIHYHPGLRNYDIFSYANTKNVLNPPPGFTLHIQENKPSLEDLVGAFVVESRNRTSKLEDVVTSLNTTVNGHGATIQNIETQLGQLVGFNLR